MDSRWAGTHTHTHICYIDSIVQYTQCARRGYRQTGWWTCSTVPCGRPSPCSQQTQSAPSLSHPAFQERKGKPCLLKKLNGTFPSGSGSPQLAIFKSGCVFARRGRRQEHAARSGWEGPNDSRTHDLDSTPVFQSRLVHA